MPPECQMREDIGFTAVVCMCRQVASAVGITQAELDLRCQGKCLKDHGTQEKHARFLAAYILNSLLCETPAWDVAEQWGAPGHITKNGVHCHMIIHQASSLLTSM